MIASRLTYILLILAAVLFACSHWMPILRNAAFVFDGIILFILFIDYQLTQRPKFLSATREVTDRLSIGRQNEVTLSVVNQGQGTLKVRVKDDYPSNLDSDVAEFDFTLLPESQSTLEYNLTPTRRGLYQFGNINIRYLSFLGLFWRQMRVEAKKPVKVYSDLKTLYDLSIKLSRSSELGELHQRKRGQGTDFASLKEYTIGDDAKMIDWKATARRDRPVVRTYEAEQEQRLVVLIDAGRMMASDLEGLTRFDHALNAALCLCLTGLSHNDLVGVGIFADKPLMYLPPRRGKGYMKSILEGAFDIEPKMVEPDYVGVLSYFSSVQKGRSLMVVLSDLTDPTGSQALLAGLASMPPRHLPFCVTLRDRQVNQMAQPMPIAEPTAKNDEDLDHIFRRAVATDLLNQRELALSVLQRRGCLVLDCPPQELSDRLVDKYLEIKTRARL